MTEKLKGLTDSQLQKIITQARPAHSAVTGKSFQVMLGETPVFVKMISLTDLERQPENVMSTANIFDLPPCYQYGIGSAGFGAWRELKSHIMTTNWVLSGECANFPLMYQWRIVEWVKTEPVGNAQQERLEQDVKYWENNQAIRKRLEAIRDASAHICLFLEYFPQTLSQWFKEQLNKGGTVAGQAIRMVEKNLETTIDFMGTRQFTHFDAHFENLLSDGNSVYFSDFGLAASSEFNLSPIEADFQKSHYNYDQCSAVTNLIHCIISNFFGNSDWEIRLQEYLEGKNGKLEAGVGSLVRRYAPVAFIMDEFYQKLRKESKGASYPAEKLENFFKKINLTPDNNKKANPPRIS